MRQELKRKPLENGADLELLGEGRLHAVEEGLRAGPQRSGRGSLKGRLADPKQGVNMGWELQEVMGHETLLWESRPETRGPKNSPIQAGLS